MAESKGLRVTIRFNDTEKELLDYRAKELGMTLSQYVRYRALEDDSMQYNEQKDNQGAIEFLDRHIAKLSRIIIDGYYCIKAMSVTQLNEAEKQVVSESGLEQFKELGITKGKEKYGKNRSNQ